MRKAEADLQAALEAAKTARDRLTHWGASAEQLDALIGDADKIESMTWSSTGPMLGAMLKICGWFLNDENAHICAGPNYGQQQFMVVNTRHYAQMFAMSGTPEGAVRAYLEMRRGDPT